VKVAGRLNTISVDLGSVVRRGQVIAQLEPNDYKLRVPTVQRRLWARRERASVCRQTALTIGSAWSRPEQSDKRRRNSRKPGSVANGGASVEQGIVAKADSILLMLPSRWRKAAIKMSRGDQKSSGTARATRSELALARQQTYRHYVHAPIDELCNLSVQAVGE